MSDELQVTINCPRCRRSLTQRAIVVERERRVHCAHCGDVPADDHMVAMMRAALAESIRKFEELDSTTRYKLK